MFQWHVLRQNDFKHYVLKQPKINETYFKFVSVFFFPLLRDHLQENVQLFGMYLYFFPRVACGYSHNSLKIWWRTLFKNANHFGKNQQFYETECRRLVSTFFSRFLNNVWGFWIRFAERPFCLMRHKILLTYRYTLINSKIHMYQHLRRVGRTEFLVYSAEDKCTERKKTDITSTAIEKLSQSDYIL